MSLLSQELPTDGREKYDWETRYGKGADGKDPAKRMRGEAAYLLVLMFIAFAAIIINYKNGFVCLLKVDGADAVVLRRVIYCLCAGLLGGTTFSIKIFYRAVARGEWNYDRRYWRLFAPVISLSVTTLVAAFMMDDIMNSKMYVAYAVGYFAGYFSENAVGKMYDVAVVLFSTPQPSEKAEDKKIQ